MSDIEAAVEEFLKEYDDAREDYDRGYVDADATVRLVDSHVEDLRDALE
ncbi:hypothetical protein HLRTI_000903 [Halorhabdus tiamatea SARL4B]|uniref:Uncharacterized protein n=1 Tax=Halorhabdus tiamatea SARL4B TaxID=1033806 RepID=F7PII1_9EURY|nr:hypothetical protein [Halorhabdus tiamatea]ERJ07045.1 hypothetical protein HLRTI_000903 [Halorhabdus tiamatea SARL4B]CCQ34811.1 conserved hypothetical protein [Halorhabdus tiamatea SARL4B]